MFVCATLTLLTFGSTHAQAPKTTQVLFLCPHGAAKSVLASPHFARLAVERGLRVKVDFAGKAPGLRPRDRGCSVAAAVAGKTIYALVRRGP